MDKIYTRKKIRLPSVKIFEFRNGRRNEPKKKLAFTMICILMIAIVTLFTVIKSISPIIDRVCEDAAKTKATIISNNIATEVMKGYTYDDFIKIYKDTNGNITMLQSNIITINEVTSDVAVRVQEKFLSDDENTVVLKFRKLYRNKNFIWNRTRYQD